MLCVYYVILYYYYSFADHIEVDVGGNCGPSSYDVHHNIITSPKYTLDSGNIDCTWILRANKEILLHSVGVNLQESQLTVGTSVGNPYTCAHEYLEIFDEGRNQYLSPRGVDNFTTIPSVYFQAHEKRLCGKTHIRDIASRGHSWHIRFRSDVGFRRSQPFSQLDVGNSSVFRGEINRFFGGFQIKYNISGKYALRCEKKWIITTLSW